MGGWVAGHECVISYTGWTPRVGFGWLRFFLASKNLAGPCPDVARQGLAISPVACQHAKSSLSCAGPKPGPLAHVACMWSEYNSVFWG